MQLAGHVTTIADITQLPSHEVSLMTQVEQMHPFRAPAHYLGLIDWTNSSDPLRNIIVPNHLELASDGMPDVCDELVHTPIQGLQHKFRSTCLLLVTDQCSGYCRFCFRKR